MTFTKILCAVDFSTGSDRALQAATQLGIQTGAEIVVAHSWHLPASAYSLEIPFPPEAIQQIVEDAQQRLDAAVRTSIAAGAKHVTARLLPGPPWTELVQLLERDAFDLCVVGTQGRTGMRHFLLGSVAEKVIRHAPCSVLALHSNDSLKPLTHVLVATDFSTSAAHSLELAAALVRPEGKITLQHVIETPSTSYPGELAVPGFEIEVEQQALAALERDRAALERASKVRVQTRLDTGSAAREILEVIRDDGTIDLVVMGSHGRTGLKRMFLGSVVEKVVRHADRPVLVARKRP